MSDSGTTMRRLSWPCPHCQTQIELAAPRAGKEWCFARCHSCGGLTLLEGEKPKLRWSEPDPAWNALIEESAQTEIATLPTRPSFVEVRAESQSESPANAVIQPLPKEVAQAIEVIANRPARVVVPPPFRPRNQPTPPPFNPTIPQMASPDDQWKVRVDSWLPDSEQ